MTTVRYLRQLPQTYGLTGRRTRTPITQKYGERGLTGIQRPTLSSLQALPTPVRKITGPGPVSPTELLDGGGPGSVMEGYHFIARPLVSCMKKSRVFTWLIKWPVLSFARHAAYKEGVLDKPNRFGRMIEIIGIPACRVIGVIKRKIDGYRKGYYQYAS